MRISTLRTVGIAAVAGLVAAALPLAPAAAAETANFSIGSLSVENPIVVDAQDITGDDRGGIAASDQSYFWTGDDDPGRWDLAGLGGASAADLTVAQAEWMTSDLESQTAYVFNESSGDLVGLTELDAVTGELTGTVIDLSDDIAIPSVSCWAVGAGWSRTAIWDWCGDVIYDIDLPSGDVSVLDATPLGDFAVAPADDWYETGSFAQSGVVEYSDGDLRFVLSAMDESASHLIGLTRFFVESAGAETQTVLDFGDTDPDLWNFTVSPQTGRWFTHVESGWSMVPESESMDEPVMSLSMSGSGGWAGIVSTIPPVHEAFVKAGDCDLANGWTESWQEWPHAGMGGPVCQRTLVYFDSLQGWYVAQFSRSTNNYVPIDGAKI